MIHITSCHTHETIQRPLVPYGWGHCHPRRDHSHQDRSVSSRGKGNHSGQQCIVDLGPDPLYCWSQVFRHVSFSWFTPHMLWPRIWWRMTRLSKSLFFPHLCRPLCRCFYTFELSNVHNPLSFAMRDLSTSAVQLGLLSIFIHATDRDWMLKA